MRLSPPWLDRAKRRQHGTTTGPLWVAIKRPALGRVKLRDVPVDVLQDFDRLLGWSYRREMCVGELEHSSEPWMSRLPPNERSLLSYLYPIASTRQRDYLLCRNVSLVVPSFNHPAHFFGSLQASHQDRSTQGCDIIQGS